MQFNTAPAHIKKTNENDIKLKRKIIKAGMKNDINVEEFWGLRIGLYVTVLILAIILIPFVENTNRIYITFTLIYLAIWPEIWIKGKIQIRTIEIKKSLPFVLSSVAIITEAGLGFMQALDEVCKMKKGELVEEFKIMIEEIEMGISRKEAFERLAERIDIFEVTMFTSSIVQSIEKGSILKLKR